jgi:hypothetical protein
MRLTFTRAVVRRTVCLIHSARWNIDTIPSAVLYTSAALLGSYPVKQGVNLVMSQNSSTP